MMENVKRRRAFRHGVATQWLCPRFPGGGSRSSQGSSSKQYPDLRAVGQQMLGGMAAAGLGEKSGTSQCLPLAEKAREKKAVWFNNSPRRPAPTR
jgi:hypothetical protein